jgi:hypothetical protein
MRFPVYPKWLTYSASLIFLLGGLFVLLAWTYIHFHFPADHSNTLPWFPLCFDIAFGCGVLLAPDVVYYEFCDHSIDYTFFKRVWSVSYDSITSLTSIPWWQSFGNFRLHYGDSQRKSLCVLTRKSFKRAFALYVPAAKIESK